MPTKKDKGAAAPEAKECANCCAIDGANGIDLRACDRCGLTDYCGKPCQTAHWKAGHKQQCLTPEQRRVPQPEPKPAQSVRSSSKHAEQGPDE